MEADASPLGGSPLEQRVTAQWLCEKTLGRFYRAMDGADIAGLLAVMHPQAQWIRRGQTLRTPEQFLASQAGKSPTLLAHHLVNNIIVTEWEAERACFAGTVTAIRSDTGAPPLPPQAPTYASVHDVSGEIRLTPAGWLLSVYRPGLPDLDVGDPDAGKS